MSHLLQGAGSHDGGGWLVKSKIPEAGRQERKAGNSQAEGDTAVHKRNF